MWGPISAASAAAGLAALGALAAQAVRLRDTRRAEALWARLADLGAAKEPVRFDPAMVDHLPAPARRYFLHAIAPGTALRTVAEIEMVGEFGLGDGDAPRYLPMRARQILAPPHGFVWIASMGSPGLMRVSGSDAYAWGEAWTRFWLLGTIPVARAAGTPDLARSAAARGIAEAALWVPAALLPTNGVAWEPIDDRRSRAVVLHRGAGRGPPPRRAARHRSDRRRGRPARLRRHAAVDERQSRARLPLATLRRHNRGGRDLRRLHRGGAPGSRQRIRDRPLRAVLPP
jgi:hypothetical protein